MRVVHVAPTSFGTAGLLGGGERYPLELARALALKIECELITFGPRPQQLVDSSGLRIRVLRPLVSLPGTAGVRLPGTAGVRLSGTARLRRRGHPAHPFAPALLTALSGADVVHTHHMRSMPSRMAALAAQLRGQDLVTTDHGLQGGDWGGILPRLFDRFLTVSEYSAEVLHAPPDKVRVIYGGADPRRFAPKPETGCAGDPDVRRDGVLFVGRITPHKGLDRLIAALPDGARLTIAGSVGHDPDLPERDYPQLLARAAAGRSVTFAGSVSDEALPALYRRAAVLALPSVHQTCYGRHIEVSELLGLVVLEAMASGTPVVCSRIGGIPEIVEHGATGFLVEPGNIDELRERLDEILRDPGLARRMGHRAREVVLERFTWQACADRCLSAYAELPSFSAASTRA